METTDQVIEKDFLEPFLDPLEEPKSEIDQLFDAAMRRWAEQNLATVVGWLDPSLSDLPPKAFRQRAATFAVPTVTADLLSAAGQRRLLHVEYETSPRKSLVTRMFNYRARIMILHPNMLLTQHVIVLGNGRVHGHDDVRNGFLLDLRVIYLRERDPAEFLTDPVLAPLAVLARGRRKTREKSFGAALRLIRDSNHPHAGELLQTAETLALIRLDPSTISRIRKENGVSIQPLVDHYRNTEVGHHLQRLGREEGRDEGLKLGRAEERREMLLALLQSRFGSHGQAAAVAAHFADWTELAAVEAILEAPDLKTLLTTIRCDAGPGS
jgi:hypothetical protein